MEKLIKNGLSSAQLKYIAVLSMLIEYYLLVQPIYWAIGISNLCIFDGGGI